MKLQKGYFIEAVWHDACSEMNCPVKVLEKKKPIELLALTKTYGIFYKQDKNAIIIISQIAEKDCDFTIIPSKWILKINIIKKVRKIK